MLTAIALFFAGSVDVAGASSGEIKKKDGVYAKVYHVRDGVVVKKEVLRLGEVDQPKAPDSKTDGSGVEEERMYAPFPATESKRLGVTQIGQEIGRTFKASEFRVVGFKRRIRNGDKKMLGSSVDTVTTDLSEVLKQSDYVVNALPSTNATRYLLTEQVLAVCHKKKPVFVNVGRGDVISENTILAALAKGLFSKAVLDVLEKEPLPKVKSSLI
ncbi:unnamed protein product [Hyaloperonospora brassicae]|uniref:D-isomer specific 2-hydroxyacid dehydrogenase NAD-binding domain-containing protein n=1 Tax=Hyaloperonospora brassicae TaxID=162125 RepID=A0AAV0T0B6_HYABA|nr:unnamed protein product [Hyaloperonospora brassicae]